MAVCGFVNEATAAAAAFLLVGGCEIRHLERARACYLRFARVGKLTSSSGASGARILPSEFCNLVILLEGHPSHLLLSRKASKCQVPNPEKVREGHRSEIKVKGISPESSGHHRNVE